MAIERLSFTTPATDPEGIPYDVANVGSDYFLRLLDHNPNLVTPLEEGSYNLTPRSWPKEMPRFDLAVLENGTAVLRSMPGKGGKWGFANIGAGEGVISISARTNGQVIKIPGDAYNVYVAGSPSRKIEEVRLYEVIYYTVGPPVPKNP